MKTKAFQYLMGLVIILFLVSCGDEPKKDVANSVFKSYAWEQQGWKSMKSHHYIGEINYTATEVPLQYYLLKSFEGDYAKVDSVYEANAKERIIEVEFQHAEQTDLLEAKYTSKSYQDAVKYMAFKIEKDFKIVTSSNDTIVCSGVNFERNFKVAPFKRVLLHFNDINPDDNIQLVYQDELFGNGIIKFTFEGTPLKSLFC